MYSRVLGTGSALPKRIVTNGEFAAMLARDGRATVQAMQAHFAHGLEAAA